MGFIYLPQCFLSIYVLGTGAVAGNETDKMPVLLEFTV